MKPHLSSPSTLLAFTLGAILFSSHFGFGFTEPSSIPPFDNVPAPLNVGAIGQSKAGGLILNTGGAVNGLIVQLGNVGIGTQSPSQLLDVAGYIKGQSGLCIGSDCRTSWPASTSYSAGSGISISGTTISNTGVLSESDPTVKSWAKANNLCYCMETFGGGTSCGSLGSWINSGGKAVKGVKIYAC